MADLVQRYLDALVAEFACVTDGALADYIPELTEVDPTGFGLTLSAADGFLSIGRCPNRILPSIHLQALHLRVGPRLVGTWRRSTPRSAWNRPGTPFNEISVDRAHQSAEERDDQRRCDRCGVVGAGRQPDEQFSKDQRSSIRPVPEGRWTSTRMSIALGRRPRDRNRAIAYMLTSFGVLADPDDVPRDVYPPAVLTEGDQRRPRANGRNAGPCRVPIRRPDVGSPARKWCSAR